MKANFTLEEIERIIETCSKNKVKEFKLDSFCISFFDHTEVRPESVEINPISAVEVTQAPESVEVDPAILQQLEAEVKQAQLDQMMLTDPVQFEELLEVGDIINDTESR